MKNKNKGGRPSKLTPKLQEDIVISIKRGDWTETTCATVGIHKSTFYDWMRRGKKETRHTKYKKFYEEVKRAQAISEVRAVLTISKAAETDWRADAWLLERRYPERWGKTKTKKNEEFSTKITDENNRVLVNFPFTELKERNKIKNIKIKISNIKNY